MHMKSYALSVVRTDGKLTACFYRVRYTRRRLDTVMKRSCAGLTLRSLVLAVSDNCQPADIMRRIDMLHAKAG